MERTREAVFTRTNARIACARGLVPRHFVCSERRTDGKGRMGARIPKKVTLFSIGVSVDRSSHKSGTTSGVHVLDFGQYIARFVMGMLLGDPGAEVRRIEPPERKSLDDSIGRTPRGASPLYATVSAPPICRSFLGGCAEWSWKRLASSRQLAKRTLSDPDGYASPKPR